MKEGDTYGEEIELKEDANVEVIPSKRRLNGDEAIVVFDLETTGKIISDRTENKYKSRYFIDQSGSKCIVTYKCTIYA